MSKIELSQKRTRIISAFPGTGKSVYHSKHPHTTLDSDSSEFSWIINEDGDKVRNPDFPANYITHIKENIGKYDFIFVSSHKDVRTALKDNCLFFYLVYPDSYDKELYIQRYTDRGSPQSFIDLITNNWNAWLNECTFEDVGCKQISMIPEWTLENEISYIISSENGDVL